MRLLSALTLFLSAALLFLIQPMIAKMILPLLGGSPAVWITCMVFFQATLLGGYLYAHASIAWLGVRRQAVLHVGLLLLALLTLPLLTLPLRLLHGETSPSGDALVAEMGTPPVEASPIPWLLGLLALSVGLPAFVVGASSPLLQKWFAGTGTTAGRDPYFLYSASNLGSMAALLGYPVFVEPWVRLAHQGWLWAAGYGLLAMLTAVCAGLLWRAPAAPAPKPAAGDKAGVTPMRRFYWVALAFIPASLLFGVTTYLSTDLAAIPLLWVVPLALYLLTFIIAFSRMRRPLFRWAAALLPALLLVHLAVILLQMVAPIGPLILLHLATFFAAALACHGTLAEDRPPTSHLTEYYLWLSVGGVLGGLFATLAAPLLFRTIAEYPLTMLLACFFGPRICWGKRLRARAVPDKRRGKNGEHVSLLGIPGANVAVPLVGGVAAAVMLAFLEAYGAERGGLWVAAGLGLPLIGCVLISLVTDRPMLFGAGSSAFMLLALTAGDYTEKTELQERDFFGVLRVTMSADGRVRFFRHGSTVHGMQWVDGEPERQREPLGYYHRRGPIGQVFAAFSGTAVKPRVGLVGLGIGSLASYGEPGQEMTFYEIDPRVRDIARSERFTYLRDCRAKVEVVMGDARLRLAGAPDGRYGLLVLDAFSSDAIPVHLLTREALSEVYLPKMTSDGVLAYHISNRYLDLRPVLGNLARDAGLACRVQVDEGDEWNGRSPSVWVVLARTEADLGPLTQDPRWQRLEGDGGAVWTDDYSNLLRVFKWW